MSDEKTRVEWWLDMVSGLDVLIDAHFVVPSDVTAEQRLRHVQGEIRDALGYDWEHAPITDNNRLYNENDELRGRIEAARAIKLNRMHGNTSEASARHQGWQEGVREVWAALGRPLPLGTEHANE